MYPNLASGKWLGDITLQSSFYVLEFHVCICRNFLHHATINWVSNSDDRFFDNFGSLNDTWYPYSNEPLEETLETFAQFPIATSFNRNQPRLLLVSVDVQEGAVVTFDSYPKMKKGYEKRLRIW